MGCKGGWLGDNGVYLGDNGVCLGCGRGWRMDVPKVAKRLKYGGFCGGFGAEGIRADGMEGRALGGCPGAGGGVDGSGGV